MSKFTQEEIEALCAETDKNGKPYWTPEDFVDTTELHVCPFQEDVNNDSTPCCNCCAYQQHQCAMDI